MLWKCWKYIWCNILFQLLEENIITFLKNELKTFKRILSPDCSECSEKWRETEAVFSSEEEEQRRSSREALVKITHHFLREMKQEEMADCLKNSKRSFDCMNRYSVIQHYYNCNKLNFKSIDHTILSGWYFIVSLAPGTTQCHRQIPCTVISFYFICISSSKISLLVLFVACSNRN